MFVINITLKPHQTDEATAAARFEQHRQWFSAYFERGTFLVLGPYQDAPHAGVIIAQTESRDALAQIIEEDVYYPLGLADYHIREFKALFIADAIKPSAGR